MKKKNSCKICEYAIFDSIMGEYKCEKDHAPIFEPTHTRCDMFKERKGDIKISKGCEDYERNRKDD